MSADRRFGPTCNSLLQTLLQTLLHLKPFSFMALSKDQRLQTCFPIWRLLVRHIALSRVLNRISDRAGCAILLCLMALHREKLLHLLHLLQSTETKGF